MRRGTEGWVGRKVADWWWEEADGCLGGEEGTMALSGLRLVSLVGEWRGCQTVARL